MLPRKHFLPRIASWLGWGYVILTGKDRIQRIRNHPSSTLFADISTQDVGHFISGPVIENTRAVETPKQQKCLSSTSTPAYPHPV